MLQNYEDGDDDQEAAAAEQQEAKKKRSQDRSTRKSVIGYGRANVCVINLCAILQQK